jgi:hypothetical protein
MHRAKWRMKAEKQLLTRGPWSHTSEISPNGIGNLSAERKLLEAPSLRTPDSEYFVSPVKVAYLQAHNFAAPKTIKTQEQENGIRTNLDSGISVGCP